VAPREVIMRQHENVDQSEAGQVEGWRWHERRGE
jgi:hypothetical protein